MLGKDDPLLDHELAAIDPSAFSGAKFPTHGMPALPHADALNDTDADDSDDEEEQEDICIRIHRAWLNERAAPEVLPCPESEITEMRELLDNQELYVESMVASKPSSDATYYLSNLCLLEAERLRYVLTDLVQTRIEKIENCWSWYLSHPANLSDAEHVYCRRYGESIRRAIVQGVLADLPPDLQAYPDESALPEPKPRLSSNVCFRALVDIGSVELAPLMADSMVRVERSDLFVASYEIIQPYLERRLVELL